MSTRDTTRRGERRQALPNRVRSVAAGLLTVLLIAEAGVGFLEALWWESTFVDPEAAASSASDGTSATLVLIALSLALVVLAVVVQIAQRRAHVWALRGAVIAAAVYFAFRLASALVETEASEAGPLLWYGTAIIVALCCLLPLRERSSGSLVGE